MTFPVVVIGAGPAGLATAAALRRRGIQALVLERGDDVGTAWRARHEDLRLNTVRWLSALPGAPIPRTAGRWVARDDYVRHLEDFTHRNRLHVVPGVTAYRIEPWGPAWRVRTSGGNAVAAHVVVATGRERVPRIPDWPGRDTFGPPVLHAAEIRRVADLSGRRVLLVGAGNSGIELAGHLVDAGVARLWLSTRTPPTILPLQVAGVPLSAVGVVLRHLPERLRDLDARWISRLTVGDLGPFGLPAPRRGPYATLRTTGVTAAVDRGFVRHLRAGRVQVVPEVSRLVSAEVELADGRRIAPDVVLTATGYRPDLADLVAHLGVLTSRGLPSTPPGRTHPGAPGLWFTGYWPALEGDLRRHPIEARRIARGIAAAFRAVS